MGIVSKDFAVEMIASHDTFRSCRTTSQAARNFTTKRNVKKKLMSKFNNNKVYNSQLYEL